MDRTDPDLIELIELAGRLAGLAVRLAERQDRAAPEPIAQEPDRLLTPTEAAGALGVTIGWLHRHSKTLPFVRKLGRRTLRYSEAGLRRWRTARRP